MNKPSFPDLNPALNSKRGRPAKNNTGIFQRTAGLDFCHIKLLAFDVDGILTDGKIYISEGGVEMKSFFVLDGAGMKLAMQCGLKVGMISARKSSAASVRAKELGLDFYIEGCKDKPAAIKPVLERYGFGCGELFYMGDDIVDAELLKSAAISATVPGAPRYIKELADIVTEKEGGRGAVREVCDIILENKGILPAF